MATRPADAVRGWHRQGLRSSSSRSLPDERARAARVAAVLKFAGHLATIPNESDIIAALLQAAAVWYDLDARAYRRVMTGRFALRASLPGASAADAPLELLEAPCVPTRVTSLVDLHHLGWHNPVGDVVLLPIPLADETEWLLAVVGPSDPTLEAELGSLCSIVGTLLERLAARRAATLSARLSKMATAVPGNARDRAFSFLQEISDALRGPRATLWHVPDGGRPQPLVSLGPSPSPPPDLESGRDVVSPERLVLNMPAWHGSSAALHLETCPGQAFTPEQADLARCGADGVRLWLAGVGASTTRVVVGDEPVQVNFESRIEEEVDRARQFGLPFSLLLVNVSTNASSPVPAGAMDELARELRAQLRSHDLVGRLAPGDIAILFTQTDAAGLAAVVQRIVCRLEAVSRRAHFPTVRIGRAVFPAHGDSVADLLLQARQGAQLSAGVLM
jgi:GGDEF domain-containing protein